MSVFIFYCGELSNLNAKAHEEKYGKLSFFRSTDSYLTIIILFYLSSCRASATQTNRKKIVHHSYLVIISLITLFTQN